MQTQNFECPKCGQDYELDHDYLNQKLQCDSCDTKFRVRLISNGVKAPLVFLEENPQKGEGVATFENPIGSWAHQELVECRRVLGRTLGVSLLGQELQGDMYLRNGFRLLGVSACSNRQTVLGVSGRLQTIIRMSSKAIGRFAIGLGYDCRLEKNEINLSISRLQDPRYRIIQELFWPHSSNGAYAAISEKQHLFAPEVIARHQELVDQNQDHRIVAKAKHALAVAYHNMALAMEFGSMLGDAVWDPTPWELSNKLWADVVSDDTFWDYLQERIDAFADPRLAAVNIADLRMELPSVILGFNVAMAQHYAGKDTVSMCRNHLALMAGSGLPDAAVKKSLIVAVRQMAVFRLEPLVQKAGNGKALEKGKRMPRSAFQKIYHPILRQVFDVRNELIDCLNVDEELVALSEFDRICEAMLAAINTRLEYDTSDRERNLLFSMLIAKRLLRLPVSSYVRRKIEGSLRQDRKHLYRDIEPPDDLDVTQCWFADGEESDPEASLLFPRYKITKREVTVDYVQQSAGVRVAFESRQVLVPRSARAAAVHDGKSSSHEAVLQSAARDDANYNPPSNLNVPPLLLTKGSQANSVLDVLEYCGGHWRAASKRIADGTIPDWFDKRGQHRLAAKVRANNGAKPEKQPVLSVLSRAAAAELDDNTKKADRETQAAIAREKADAAKQQQVIETQHAAELNAHDKRVAAKKSAIETKKNDAAQEYEALCLKEREKADQGLARARQESERFIEQAREMYLSTLKRNGGIAGFLRWQLLVGLLGAASGVFMAPHIPSGIPEALQTIQHALGLQNEMFTISMSVLLVGTCGVLGGSLLRMAFGYAAAKRFNREQKRQADRIASQAKSMDAKIADIKREGDNIRIALDQEIHMLAKERAGIISAAQSKINKIKKVCKAAAQAMEQKCASEKQQNEQRLTKYFSVKSKDKADGFPALKKARSVNYKEGKEPSQYEMQMTDSERQQAILKLQVGMRFGNLF